MARTLEQIVAELNPTFQPQVQSLQNRAADIPGQVKAEQAGLQAKQGEAFNSILGGARQRGLGFSGIPLGEQARYTATEYLPALARLQQSGRDQAMSLQDAILGVNERRDTLAQNIFQTEEGRAAQERQASAARAAAASPSFGSLGGIPGSANTPPAGARAQERSPGNFAFFDGSNQPITAAQYARSTGQEIGDVLFNMAQKGDQSAASWYGILQREAMNNDNGVGYNNALTQAMQRAPQIFGGMF
jgi:hypothetical protein